MFDVLGNVTNIQGLHVPKNCIGCSTNDLGQSALSVEPSRRWPCTYGPVQADAGPLDPHPSVRVSA